MRILGRRATRKVFLGQAPICSVRSLIFDSSVRTHTHLNSYQKSLEGASAFIDEIVVMKEINYRENPVGGLKVPS